MNFLEIVRKTSMHSGLHGDVESVSTVRGIQRELVETVKSSYHDIQMFREDWNWMKTEILFSWLTTSTGYSNDLVRRFDGVSYNDKFLKFIPYEKWGDNQVEPPARFTIGPETNKLIVNKVPEAVQLKARVYLKPERLISNTQIPRLPSHFHYLIVYKAAANMAASLGNADRFSINISQYDQMMIQLLRSQNIPKTIKQRPLV